MTQMSDDEVRAAVQDRYSAAARGSLGTLDESGGCCSSGSCCGSEDQVNDRCCAEPMHGVDPITSGLYDELANDPDHPFDAAIAASLGCGNPTALAQLNPGEDVLDLGSGGGLDVLLSAKRVGPDGMAYGLDMTPEMLALAERHKAEAGIENATFMLGAIEEVPLPDSSVDVVISNCVINLSPDKDAVLREAFRVLRPKGRFAVADIVLTRPIPTELRNVVGLWTGCISGSLLDTEYADKLAAVGFTDIGIEITRSYDRDDLIAMGEGLRSDQLPTGMSLEDVVEVLTGAFASAFVRATKPA